MTGIGVNIQRVLEPLWQEKKVTIQANFVYLLRWLLPLLWIVFTKYLITLLELKNVVLFHQKIELITICVVIYFTVRFLTTNRWRVKTFWIYQKTIRKVYLKKILYIDNNSYDKIGTWNLISIVEKWVQAWSWLLVNTIRYSRSVIITLILNIYYIYQVNPWYVLVFVVLVAAILYVWLKADNMQRKYRNERREAGREGVKRIVKLFMSKFDVLQNDKIELELQQVARSSDDSVAANKKMWLFTEIFFLWPQMLVYALLIAFFYYWWNWVLQGTMTFSFFYWVVSALFLLQNTLDKSLTVLKDISKDRADVEKLRDLVDNNPTIQWIEEWAQYVFSRGDIELSKVSFAYHKTRPILEEFDLHIAAWKKIALVGPSWAGKTTIIKLIAGYIQAMEWYVAIDWQLLPHGEKSEDHISLKSYYKHIGYLTQEPSVFDGTVYENLIYALDYEPSKEQLDRAIQQAQCQFTYDLPHWLETHIGEKGIRLSGGQRQRLAIAKIFLKNPKIILLDEPTSALDSLSEEAITKALDILFEGRTVVIVAHRLQTVKKADDIVVLDWGKIIERGTHAQLVALGWQYATMLELQSWF